MNLPKGRTDCDQLLSINAGNSPNNTVLVLPERVPQAGLVTQIRKVLSVALHPFVPHLPRGSDRHWELIGRQDIVQIRAEPVECS
jgi:hypothetical protein